MLKYSCYKGVEEECALFSKHREMAVGVSHSEIFCVVTFEPRGRKLVYIFRLVELLRDCCVNVIGIVGF